MVRLALRFTMPELVECVASWLLANERMHELQAEGASMQVRAIWVDGSSKEIKATSRRSNPRLKAGLVYRLDSRSKVERGNVKAQTPVWPSFWTKTRLLDTKAKKQRQRTSKKHKVIKPTKLPKRNTRSQAVRALIEPLLDDALAMSCEHEGTLYINYGYEESLLSMNLE